MLGDTLLDFLHLYASAGLLFDHYGRLLYANRGVSNSVMFMPMAIWRD